MKKVIKSNESFGFDEEILEFIKEDWKNIIQKVFKKNHKLILSILAKSRNYLARRAVAKNSSTPGNVLARLSKDYITDVRCDIAQNPNAPANILKRLSKDPHHSVRYFVAGNPSTPSDVLEKLLKDKHKYVRTAVAGRLKNSF